MATTDLYKSVKYTNGEEIVEGDLIDQQQFLAAKLADQVFRFLVPHVKQGATPFDPDFPGNNETAPSVFTYALALHGGQAYLRQGSAHNKLQIAPGTLMQIVAAADGSTPQVLSYTFDGTGDQFTITNGDAANPRVDLLQMKLALVDGDLQSRAVLVAGVKASLDLSTKTTNDNTKVQAKVPGVAGNDISISFAKRVSGSGVTYSENGNAVLVQYEDGVSTVADVEAAIIASSTLLEIKSTGTAANVLHDPVDSFAYTHLASGADEIIEPTSVNKKTQVQCTLSVKQGTPAASPIYPDPDAGFVAVGGVVVGATYAAAADFLIEDTAGAVAVLHDQRMPLGVRTHHVMAKSFVYDPAQWTEQNYGVIAPSVPVLLQIVCPTGGPVGRLLGCALVNNDSVSGSYQMSKFFIEGNTAVTGNAPVRLATAADLNGATSGLWKRRLEVMSDFEQAHAPAAGPTVQASGNASIGPPIWTNGKRAPDQPFKASQVDLVGFEAACISIASNFQSVGPATFWVAAGLGS